jgi:hypothetical protein
MSVNAGETVRVLPKVFHSFPMNRELEFAGQSEEPHKTIPAEDRGNRGIASGFEAPLKRLVCA